MRQRIGKMKMWWTRAAAMLLAAAVVLAGPAMAVRAEAGKLVSVGPKFVILQTDSANYAVPPADVTRLQVLELPVRVHVSGKGGKDAAKSTLGMAYLRKGITWIPEYTMKIIDDDTAELRLRGTLVNEAEDLFV